VTGLPRKPHSLRASLVGHYRLYDADSRTWPLPAANELDQGVIEAARDELLAAYSVASMRLWRQRLLTELVDRAVEGRGSAEAENWARLIFCNGGRDDLTYSNDEVLAWASEVVCRFETLARADKQLDALVKALDRQDMQATQLAQLDAAQGMRRTMAIALCLLLVALPVDAEALHLLF
jgi:hypothetical protein